MEENHLHILWTNADPTVFDKMVLMYAVNSLVRGWWEKVTVILWGDTAALAAHDPAVGERIALAGRGGGAAEHGSGGHLLGAAPDGAHQEPGASAHRLIQLKTDMKKPPQSCALLRLFCALSPI